MVNCAVVGCGSNSNKDKGRSFFRFPTVRKREGLLVEQVSSRRRLKWISNIRRKNFVPSNDSRVCDLHFVAGKPASLMNENDPSWAPTVNINPLKADNLKKVRARVQRYERLVNRRMIKNAVPVVRQAESDAVIKEEVTLDLGTEDIPATLHSGHLDPLALVECVTEQEESNSIVEDVSSQQCFVAEVAQNGHCSDTANQLSVEVCTLKPTEEKLMVGVEDCRFIQHSFEMLQPDLRDSKVMFYTGLPTYALLTTIFGFLSPYLESKGRDYALSLFQQFVLVMMKLRLGLSDKDLAHRFKVDRRSIPRYFGKWIEIMYRVLVPTFIRWPDRRSLDVSMPMCFRPSFIRSVSIISCMEIFVSRSRKSQFLLSYKSPNRVKFLISIAPQGAVTFISPAYPGCMNDKYFIEHSKFLDQLVPGDLIWASHGFSGKDGLQLYRVDSRTQTLAEDKQLSPQELQHSSNISCIGIHVETVIGALQEQFKITQGPVNNAHELQANEEEQVSFIEKIVSVCCALFNCCPPVVSSN